MAQSGKPGPKAVDPASKGTSPALGWSTAGTSTPATKIGGNGSGGPVSLKRALAKKAGTGTDATGAAGMVR